MAATAVLLVTALVNTAIAVADLLRAPFVLANGDAVHVPRAWMPWLALAKLAGAAGLVAGAAGAEALALAGGLGLVAFFGGALAMHLRAGVVHNLAFPGAFLALAAACVAVSG